MEYRKFYRPLIYSQECVLFSTGLFLLSVTVFSFVEANDGGVPRSCERWILPSPSAFFQAAARLPSGRRPSRPATPRPCRWRWRTRRRGCGTSGAGVPRQASPSVARRSPPCPGRRDEAPRRTERATAAQGDARICARTPRRRSVRSPSHRRPVLATLSWSAVADEML